MLSIALEQSRSQEKKQNQKIENQIPTTASTTIGIEGDINNIVTCSSCSTSPHSTVDDIMKQGDISSEEKHSSSIPTQIGNLQAALDVFETDKKDNSIDNDDTSSLVYERGRSLTFGSEMDLNFPIMTVDEMVSTVISSPKTHHSATVSSSDSHNNAPPPFPTLTVSHTPPSFSASFEEQHFGKRQRKRSDSISGRLRSASDLEDQGIIDKRHKEVLKDLIVSGDAQVLAALDQYEQGDSTALNELIKGGTLSNLMSQDIDLLGDLDLDFLTFHDHDNTMLQDSDQVIPVSASSAALADDGVGELEFTFGSEQAESLDEVHPELMHMPLQAFKPASSSGRHSRSASTGSIVENGRLRSNTFGSLCDDIDFFRQANQLQEISFPNLSSNEDEPSKTKPKPAEYNNTTQQPSQPSNNSNTTPPIKKKNRGRPSNKEKKLKSTTTKEKKKYKSSEQIPEVREPVPSGLGLPRTFSDPNLTSVADANGLFKILSSPDGWVGAYSPTSRKMRIERFIAKRSHRVWTKKVKYDVRKNFADSRLRVKGRFVKKEDETLMRELISLT